MKKKKVFFILAGVAFLFLGFFLWGMKKGDWIDAMEAFGPVNIMEQEENCSANYHNSIFPIKKDREYQILGTLNITNGSAKLRYRVNDEVVFEKTYDAGNYNIEEYFIKKQEGELQIELEASDDVGGSYDFFVKQRRRNITRWKDNYFSD